MFNSLRQNFHLSQATVSAKSEHVPHHRPLGLLLLLTFIAWQSGVFSAFAAALPVAPLAVNQGYVYIQHNPLVDDSWIGTRVSLVGAVPAIQTSPTVAPTQTIDTSWLGNFIRNKKPNTPTQGALPVVTQPAPYPTMPIVYTTPNGTLLNNISSSYSAPVSVSLVNSVFGRNGAVIGQSGDYTTTLVTEGTNLYFTDLRAQDALSGSLANIGNSINTLSGSIGTLSGSLATAIGNIATLSGSLATTNSDLLSLSGTVANKIGLTALSALGPLTYNNATGVFGIDLANSTTTGALSAIDWNTFNSKESVLTFGTGITRVGNTIGLTTGADGDILSMASGVPTWVTPAAVSVPVLSVFGRTGSILATLGDYTTSLVTEGSNLYFTQGRFDTAFSGKTTTDLTEGTNLYFTDTRAQDALSGSIANISNSINTLSGSLVALSSTVDTLSGVVASNYAVLSGALSTTNATLIATNIDLASLSGTVNTLSGFVSTLSTTVSTISGPLVALSSTVDSLSGSLALTDADVSSISGALAALTTTVNTLSGTVSTILTDVSTLSGSLAITDSNLAALSGSLATLTSTVDTISGSLATTIGNLSTLSSTVATNYTTLSGAIATTNATLASLSGTVAIVQGDVSTLSGQVALLQGLSHDALTLGTANGLSLSVQQLSLSLANSTTTGALSATDWNTFNNKIGLTDLSAGGGITYNNTTGVFGWNGTTTNVAEGTNLYYTTTRFNTDFSGRSTTNLAEGTNLYYTTTRANTDFDTRLATKTTTNLTEGTNLYFTDTRAQNALSGTVNTLSGDIATNSANIATNTADIATNTSDIATNTAHIGTLSGSLATAITDISSLSGVVSGVSSLLTSTIADLSSVSGSLATTIANLASLSGTVANKIGLTDLSAGGGITYNNTTGVFGWNGTTTNVAEGTNLYYTTTRFNTDFSGRSTTNLAEGTNLYYTTTRANTDFDTRLATKTTTNLTEGTNLYFTDTRAQNALSGTVNTLSGDIATNSANIATNTADIATNTSDIATNTAHIGTLSGSLATAITDISSLSGVVSGVSSLLTSTIADLSSVSGSLATTIANLASLSGTVANKIGLTDLSAGGGITYNNTTGVFGWNGTTTNVAEGTNLYYTTTRFNTDFSGRSTTNLAEGTNLYYTTTRANTDFDTRLATKTTTNLTEGTNLYFTDTRAQNALSGTVNTLSGDIATNSANIATNTADIATNTSDIATNTAHIGTLSGSLATAITDISSLSGVVSGVSSLLTSTIADLSSVSGSLATTIANLASLSGTVANKIGLTDLSAGGGITYNNTTGVFGWNGTTTNVAEGTNLYYTTTRFNTDFSGRSTTNLAEGTNLYYTTTRANTDFDTRLATKTTTNLTEGTNLYFTDTRARTALSITGPLTYNNSTGVFGINQSSTSVDGYLSSTDWNTFNNKIGTIGTANGLSIAGTGISLALAGTSSTGALSATDWNAFNNKESVLTFGTGITRVGNTVGLTNTGITFAIGTTGTDMNWSTAFTALGGTATLNIPDASLTARGLVSTGSQVFAGAKTFATAPTLSGFTLGSVLFASTGGILAQNNTSFFWDNANTRLGIGISSPTATLHVQNNLLTTTNLLTLTATGLTTGNALQIIGSGSRNLFRVSQNTTDPLDIERVTIGQGGISATKPDGLARDQLYVFGRINSSWNSMSEDFMTRRANAVVTNDTTFNNTLYFDDATGGGAAAGWQVDVVTSPGISGMARLSTQTTGVNFNSRLMTSTNVTQRSLNPVFEARVLGTITANHRIQVGFANTVVGSTWTADATYGGQTDGIFFRKNAAGTVWQTVTRAGGVETTNNTAMSTNAYRTLRIEVNNVVGNATFYIDGVLQFTHTTNLPAAATALGYGIGTAMSVATAGLTVDIDYIRVWSDDPPTTTDIPEPGEDGYVSDLFAHSIQYTEIEDTLDFITTQTIVTTLSRFLDATGTGVLDTSKALAGDNTMDLADTGNYLVQLIKRLIERLSEVWLEMTLYVRSLQADEIKTEKLCLGETCITEEELKALLQSRGVQSSSSSVSSGYTAPVTETTTGSTDTTATGTTESTSDIAADTGDSIPTEPIPIVDTTSDDTIIPDTIVAPDTPIIP